MGDIPTIDPNVLRDAYHGILELGMENLQRYRLPERFDYLAIEIDHYTICRNYMHETNVFVLLTITVRKRSHFTSNALHHFESSRLRA